MGGSIGAVALVGMQPNIVRVEAAINPGLPTTRIVGLPDAAVREAADRLRSACLRSGLKLPQARLVINLSPGGIRKSGAGFDLPVALSLLVAAGHLAESDVEGVFALGELGLDGAVHPTPGTLPIVTAARTGGGRTVIVAEDVAPEASLVDGIEVIGVRSLREAVDVLAGTCSRRPTVVRAPIVASQSPDMSEVRGQPIARRALEIAAAGAHHILMVGPPGCGKSMLAQRLPGIVPVLDVDAALEVAAIRSIAGERSGDEPLELTAPFRAPHHTTSVAGLIGGGSGVARPGEISLAHNGVLFLDELLETPRWILDALRQPLETERVVLVRANSTATYPARIQLVAATNPCPCGGGTDPGSCRCRPDQVERYRSRLSGPLLDRIDLQVELAPVSADLLAGPSAGEASSVVLDRVNRARAVSGERWGPTTTNRDVADGPLRASAAPAAITRLVRAITALGLSVRAFDRCLRVARTIADLAGDEQVGADHVDEAVSYRLAEVGAGVVAR